MSRLVVIDYTNWRGERRKRTIEPLAMMFDVSAWHPEKQWILVASDVERDPSEAREFAMKNIHSWRPHGQQES